MTRTDALFVTALNVTHTVKVPKQAYIQSRHLCTTAYMLYCIVLILFIVQDDRMQLILHTSSFVGKKWKKWKKPRRICQPILHICRSCQSTRHTVNSSPGQLVTQSTRHRSTRHPVNSSRSRLVTKRRSTRHKQTSKPYCQQCIGPSNFLAVVFKKQKKFTASSHQNARLYIW